MGTFAWQEQRTAPRLQILYPGTHYAVHNILSFQNLAPANAIIRKPFSAAGTSPCSFLQKEQYREHKKYYHKNNERNSKYLFSKKILRPFRSQ